MYELDTVAFNKGRPHKVTPYFIRVEQKVRGKWTFLNNMEIVQGRDYHREFTEEQAIAITENVYLNLADGGISYTVKGKKTYIDPKKGQIRLFLRKACFQLG
jgi:hypothetical protein